jgi:hypothetical protein
MACGAPPWGHQMWQAGVAILEKTPTISGDNVVEGSLPFISKNAAHFNERHPAITGPRPTDLSAVHNWSPLIVGMDVAEYLIGCLNHC